MLKKNYPDNSEKFIPIRLKEKGCLNVVKLIKKCLWKPYKKKVLTFLSSFSVRIEYFYVLCRCP